MLVMLVQPRYIICMETNTKEIHMKTNTKIKITQEAYLTGTTEGTYYVATGTLNGVKGEFRWTSPDMDCDDQGFACDWDCPDVFIGNDGKVVTLN